LDSLKEKMPTLKYLIYTDKLETKSKEYEIMSYDEVVKLGEENVAKDFNHPKADSIAFLMYTSGSTGAPKGVMILHKNIVAFVGAINFMWKFDCETVYIGYLPLAHVLELAAENTILQAGGSIGYGNPRTLTDKGAKPCGDIKAVRPTHMAGVPRVWDTIKKGVLEKVEASGGLKSYLFHTAFATRLEAVRSGQDTPIWNWLVFSKLHDEMGGRMKAMISGGAPLNKDTQEFIRVCFGKISQGYGLTETCGGLTVQDLDKFSTGNVGHPLPSCEVMLESVPEMKYDATPDEKSGKRPEGEICIRGNNVTAGYYKNQEKTDEEWRDGWFHTGDVGRFNKDGTISVIDRKKNLIKLSQGEYVALESLEMYSSFFINFLGVMELLHSFLQMVSVSLEILWKIILLLKSFHKRLTLKVG
jgi:long-chain acyl-CoA synthetase